MPIPNSEFRISSSRLRSVGLICLALVGMVVFFFPRAATFQGFFFLGDFLQQFYPYLTYSFERILGAGEWPLWTDRMRLGYPLFAEGQAGLLFPTSWAYLILPGPMAFSVVVLGNVFLAGAGMIVFLKSQKDGDGGSVSNTAALTGAAVYAFSGRFLISIIGVSDMRVLGMLPWCLWAVRRLFQKPAIGRMAACALVLSLLGLAGKPDVAFQAAVVILIAAGWWWFEKVEELGKRKGVEEERQTNWGEEKRVEELGVEAGNSKFKIPKGGRIGEGDKRRTLNSEHSNTPILQHSVLLFVLAGLLALALSAVQWVPTLELLGQSVRREPVSLERWIAGSLPPKQMLSFFVPWLFGNPYEGTYIGGWSFLYLELYLGPVAGVLIVLGLFRRREDRWLWAGLALLGLLLALGQYLPGYSLLHELPFLNRGRVPGRWLHLTLVGISMLAAWGVPSFKSQNHNPESKKGQANGEKEVEELRVEELRKRKEVEELRVEEFRKRKGVEELRKRKEVEELGVEELRKRKGVEELGRGEEGGTSNVEMAASTLQRSNTPVVISFVFISVVILISALFAFSDPPSSFPHYTHGGTKVFYEKDTGRTGLLAMQRRVGWSQAALLLGLVGAVLAAGKNSSSLRRWVGPALLGLLLLDQRLHLSAINPTQPARVYEAKSPVIEFLKRQSPGSRFYSHRSHVPAYYLARTRFRRGTDGKVIDSFYRHLTPNSALLAGLYDAGGYGELDLAGRSEPGLNPAGLKMLASRGVRYVVTLKEEVPKGVKAIFGSAEVAVFEIRSMPYQSIAKDGAGKWMLLRRESYYPGWAGFVNGRRVPVHRAEGIFQGLEWEGAEKSKTKNQTRDRKRDHGTMGPWDHRASNDEVGRQFGIPNSRVPVVEFVFEPLSFRVGLAVSLAALLILIAMSVFACTQKRQFTGSSD